MSDFIEIQIKDSHRLLNAGNLILVSAQSGDSRTITPVAWQMPVSSNPKLVVIALGHKRYCLELIKKSNCFCINIPDAKLIDAIKICGSFSGRDIDKCKEAKLTPIKSSRMNCFHVQECVAFMECEVYKFVEVGDHTIVVGEVKAAFGKKGILTADGILDTDKFKIISHLGGDYFAELKLIRK